jgi:hypothetical protein
MNDYQLLYFNKFISKNMKMNINSIKFIGKIDLKLKYYLFSTSVNLFSFYMLYNLKKFKHSPVFF